MLLPFRYWYKCLLRYFDIWGGSPQLHHKYWSQHRSILTAAIHRHKAHLLSDETKYIYKTEIYRELEPALISHIHHATTGMARTTKYVT